MPECFVGSCDAPASEVVEIEDGDDSILRAFCDEHDPDRLPVAVLWRQAIDSGGVPVE